MAGGGGTYEEDDDEDEEEDEAEDGGVLRMGSGNAIGAAVAVMRWKTSTRQQAMQLVTSMARVPKSRRDNIPLLKYGAHRNEVPSTTLGGWGGGCTDHRAGPMRCRSCEKQPIGSDTTTKAGQACARSWLNDRPTPTQTR